MNKPIPDVRSKALEALLEVIKVEQLRTGLNPTQLLKQTSNAPEGLKPVYLKIKDKTISFSHAAFIIDTYKSLPTVYLKREEHLILALREEIERTGVKLKHMFEREDMSCDDLSLKSIQSWIHNKKMKRIKKVEYDRIMQAYSLLPDLAVAITRPMLKRLKAEIDRTKARSTRFILNDPDRPDGLLAKSLDAVIEGNLNEVPKKHWEFIEKRYKQLPTARGFSGKTPIKEES